MGKLNQKNSTFWWFADHFPPILVRLLAKENDEPISTVEIASRIDHSMLTVETISHSTDWRGIDFPTMKAFLFACGVDFCDGKKMNRLKAYLKIERGPRYEHLRRSKDWLSYYQPMLTAYREHLKTKLG